MGYGLQGSIISGLDLNDTTKCITFVIHLFFLAYLFIRRINTIAIPLAI